MEWNLEHFSAHISYTYFSRKTEMHAYVYSLSVRVPTTLPSSATHFASSSACDL